MLCDPRRGGRQERLDLLAQDPGHLQQVGEDRVQAAAGVGVARGNGPGELPRPQLGHRPVGVLDHAPDGIGRTAEVVAVDGDIDRRGETASGGQQLAAPRLVRRPDRSPGPGSGQRDDPADEVSEPVRELGGGTGQRALPEVEVADARHAPHEPPAQRVGRVRVGQRGRIGAVAARLADLPAVDRQVVVDDDRASAAARPR